MYTNPGEWQWTSAHHGQVFVWWHSAWPGCEGCCPAGERHHKCWHWWCWTLMNQFVHNCMNGWIVDIWLGSTARGKKNCFEAYGLALKVVVMPIGYNNHGGGANSDSCSPVVSSGRAFHRKLWMIWCSYAKPLLVSLKPNSVSTISQFL